MDHPGVILLLIPLLIVVWFISIIWRNQHPEKPRPQAGTKLENSWLQRKERAPARGTPQNPDAFTKMSLYKEKAVGVSKKNNDGTSRQQVIAKLQEGNEVQLVRDPENDYDENAIEVWNKRGDQIGFIDKMRAEELSPQMDSGYPVEVWVDRIWGGDDGKNLGVLIAIQRYKPKPAAKS